MKFTSVFAVLAATLLSTVLPACAVGEPTGRCFPQRVEAVRHVLQQRAQGRRAYMVRDQAHGIWVTYSLPGRQK